MRQIQLLSDEHNVMSSNDDTLMLTNLRVKYEASNGGGSAYKSIPLKKVSACALTTKKYPLLLVLAGLAILGVLAAPSEPLKIGAAILAVALIAAYFFARNGQLEVFSDSGASIAMPTRGLTHDQVRIFAEAVALEVSKVR